MGFRKLFNNGALRRGQWEIEWEGEWEKTWLWKRNGWVGEYKGEVGILVVEINNTLIFAPENTTEGKYYQVISTNSNTKVHTHTLPDTTK